MQEAGTPRPTRNKFFDPVAKISSRTRPTRCRPQMIEMAHQDLPQGTTRTSTGVQTPKTEPRCDKYPFPAAKFAENPDSKITDTERQDLLPAPMPTMSHAK